MPRRFNPGNYKSSNRFKFLCTTLLFLLLFLFLYSQCAAAEIKDLNPLRFQKEINRFSWQDAKNTFPEQAILFVGSSSIYSWKTAQAFPTLPVINRGFGGSHISDLNYYYDVIVKKYKPTKIVFYCGDNDVTAGKSTLQILNDFRTFMSRLKKDLPHTTLMFLAIKPSPVRWQLWENMSTANSAIKEYCATSRLCVFLDTATPLFNSKGLPDKVFFAEDGLHLNSNGYAIWNQILIPYFSTSYTPLRQ